MEHIVVLIGQIVDFSTLHPLQLTVVDGSETVSDGDDERYGSSVDGGSVQPPLDSGPPVKRDGTWVPPMHRSASARLVHTTSPD